ncbi:bifunctional cytochrome P450/NADPH--P450 reductase [Streptantibioticus silvisoli]|uniref:Bifunctional cytochrome P450/NADPH--P450 reductase n=1 Tax=Streptantibioticus silvisoli TaxID=2705255 RepID=A0ABT6W1I6_9ACTN|nr:cytochrome P450 [Streptantibioticus silvisoli]MDI5964619.1 cytochrome P450 [Streptantibioticus silvisoli]
MAAFAPMTPQSRPAGDDGVPLVDVSDQAPSSTPIQTAMALLREHGPVVRRRRHGRDTLIVADLDVVTELADDRRFAKHINPGLENVRAITADGLFTAYNDEPNWAKAHDILMPAFALGSMRTYHPAMLGVCRRLIDSWDRQAAAGTPVDVSGDMTRMTLDTIGLAGFGYDFGSFERDEPHPFISALVRGLNWSMAKVSDRPGDDHTARDAAFRADADFLAGVVDEVIEARTTSGDTSSDDLLGLMLQARHPSDGTTLDRENIRNQVVTFLIAGHETTSGTLSFALHFLLKHPAVLRLVQREADDLWGDDAEPEPSYEDIGRLTYTRQVLNETLRLWPTAAAFSRTAREDTTLGGSIEVKAGQDVLVLAPMLHRQPVWGDNPELFDPARFAPEAEAARSPHAYKPFGTGERACIGRQFALHEASMLLAMLAHRYRFIDQDDYRLEVKETLTLKPEGFTLTPVPRTAADRAANRAALPHAAAVAEESAATGDGLPTRVRQGTGALFLHGSNYGTCRSLSAQLADEAADFGCETAVAPLDDHAGALPTDRPVVITAASYNGRPTDDAVAFAAWLADAGPGAADGVSYAVLGIGDRNWAATYQHMPTYIDERLASLGGTRLTDRAAADASGDLAGAVKAFTARLRTALLTAHGDPATVGAPTAAADRPAYTVTEVTGGPLDALAARHDLVAATVTEAYDLTGAGHARVKRFVRLALPHDNGYRTADHLAVLPENDPALVARAATLFDADPDTVLNIAATAPRRDGIAVDRPLTVRQLLTHHVELQDRPTAAHIGVLAALNPCPPERAALEALAADGDTLAADPRTLLDVIEDHPALREVLTWPVLLELLPAMRTRMYSISSSPQDDPDHADLMVSLLDAPARSGRGGFRGTGSGYLNRVRPGQSVLVRVQPCREAFRVPHEATVPLILVSAGTGLAPFRGALRDRLLLADRGAPLAPAVCYFGCDAPDADYLHATELRAAELAGVVSLRPAFSHAPVDGARYVQHRIAAEGDEVWKLLGEGARVYVCGDGTRMAPGVRAAFQELYARQVPDATADAAREWLDSLVGDGRYVEDVYTG